MKPWCVASLEAGWSSVTDRHPASAAFRDSAPVFFGYLPLGIAFGVLFATLGYAWWFAPLAGVLVYAGSAQFLAVALIAAGAGLVETFLATFLLNARHIFYGMSVLNRYPARGWLRWYLMFGLTDETYALVTSRTVGVPGTGDAYYGYLTAFNQSYWVLGCAVGAVLQSALAFDASGFEFALVALFAVLWVEQLRRVTEWKLLLGGVGAALGLAVWLGSDFLLPACVFCLLATLFWQRRAHVIQ